MCIVLLDIWHKRSNRGERKDYRGILWDFPVQQDGKRVEHVIIYDSKYYLNKTLQNWMTYICMFTKFMELTKFNKLLHLKEE